MRSPHSLRIGYFGSALACGALLIACGSGSSGGSGTANNTGGTAAGGGVTVGGSANGGSALGGSNSGGAGGNAGSSAGGTNSSGQGNGAGQSNGGSAGGPSGAPTGITLTTHDLMVPSGVVFNVADDYFNDQLIPPTPVANFGSQSQITTIANDDGSLDIAWLDYTNGKGKPWAVNSPSMIYLTHVDPALATATTTPSGVSSYKLLGFAKDAANAVYLAYTKDHPFKNATKNDPNNLNGNELHVTKLSGGSAAWDQLIFGDKDNSQEATLGDPGGAASGVLGYDAKNDKVVLYVGHTMMWDGIRHQAGFIRLLNPSTGAIIPPSGDDIIHFGAGWWYSHNFNQRLIVDNGNYYLLAHGDAYSRQLGFARWSLSGYTSKNDTDFNEPYFTIAGAEGDNDTNAQTGQFIKMADRFLMVHTTSQGRAARDVRLVFANGSSGKADAKETWLTTNQGTSQATMPKLEQLGDYVLVTYALWDSKKDHELTWYVALLDQALATVAAPKPIPKVEFVDSAPLFRFKGGPNQNKVGWVSGNPSHTLTVQVAALAH